jgi:diguanylate cyclase (GGDEF)-like protein/PAS domain S-box-containing protein
MNPIDATPPPDRDPEVSALVEKLLKTGRRLEELTAGQVDMVLDREGRTFLLRGTQQQLVESEVAKQAAILNALPADIALLDINGTIVSVNDSWRRFPTADEMPCSPGHEVGTNYLAVCERTVTPGSTEAHLVAAGIRSVLGGSAKSFSFEYECGLPLQPIWFLLTVTPLASGGLNGAIVMHSDITATKKAREVLRQSDENLRMLVTGVKDYAILMLDLDGFITTWNAGAERIKGYRAEEIIGRHFSTFYSPESQAEGLPALELKIASEEGRFEDEGWRIRKDGSRFWANVLITALHDAAGELRGFGKVTRDITERKQAEEALFAEKERAEVTLKSIGDAVICTDVSGDITFLNLVAEKVTGWSSDEAFGRPMYEVFRILDVTSRLVITDPMDMAVEHDRTMHLPSNCILVRRDGVEIPIEDSIAPIHNREGEPTGAVIVFRDVSASRAMTEQIEHSAGHDALTGLPNRTLLNDRLNQAIASALRHGTKVALLFLDLDGFKHINDSLGHPVGDKLLQSISKRLVDSVRASDTVSRQGGDEFIVLLLDVQHPGDTTPVAKKILEAIADAHLINDHDLHVTGSIGISVYPDDGLDAETLIKNADTAMYHAKEDGHQMYRSFEPAMNTRAVQRQSTEESLRRALERNELALAYQPKISLKTGMVTGAEALLRWTHPLRGQIAPAEFISIAEECGLILPIGSWVLREACKQARAWADAGLPRITMAVNISGNEFRDKNFLASVLTILENTGLETRFLELELTESVLMKYPEAVEPTLRALRTRDVQLAVDDFGTGYSSLSYLSKFSIDALKIDQSFVRQIATRAHETAIVSAIISMGRSLNLRVIAEGVETEEELAFLQTQHCDEAQGYLFSRPLPPAEFAKVLEKQSPYLNLCVEARTEPAAPSIHK